MDLTDEQKYHLLLEITNRTGDTFDLAEIMEHLLDAVQTVVPYDAAGIFVLNQDIAHPKGEQPKDMIAGMIRRGYDARPIEDDPMLRFGKGIIGQVIRSSEHLIVPDVHQDSRYVEGRSRSRSEIAVPILRNNHAIGALNLENDRPAAYGENDLQALQFFASAAAIALHNAMLHRQILEKKLIDRQLELAREVQWSLFPNEPPRIPGYDIAGICIPAEEIGGDYYDFLKLPHGGLGVALADVSGNGIPAALMMTSFRGLLRMHARGTFKPARVARAINRLLPEFTADNDFITAVYVVIDTAVNEFTYVCCGHTPPLLRQSQAPAKSLDLHGPALGVIHKANYDSEKMPLNPGDQLILYTDGVVDITNPRGEEYGIERLKKAVDMFGNCSASEMIEKIIANTREFSGSHSYKDDFTLVVIRRE